MNDFKRTYTTFESDNLFGVNAETEDEKKLLKELKKTFVEKMKRKKNDGYDVKIPLATDEDGEIKQKLDLRACTKEFIEFKELRTSKRDMLKYIQAIGLLEIYFTPKQRIDKITAKEANKFQDFLIQLPKNFSQKKEFQNKNMKLLIEKKNKLLDGLETISKRTSDTHIKRVKAIFNFFVDNDYMIKNPFIKVETLAKKGEISWKEFKPKDMVEIFMYLDKDELREEYNFMKFALYTGLRRGETCKISKEDINLDESFILLDGSIGTKSENAKRVMVLHKDIIKLVEEQMQGKNDEDLLFYNDLRVKMNENIDEIEKREGKVGKVINEHILAVVGEEKKKNLNIHSLRKNFSQETFISDEFNMLEMKTMIGHSTGKDTTDTHYLMGRRDYKKLKQKIDNVDFSEFFPRATEILNKDSNNALDNTDIF